MKHVGKRKEGGKKRRRGQQRAAEAVDFEQAVSRTAADDCGGDSLYYLVFVPEGEKDHS